MSIKNIVLVVLVGVVKFMSFGQSVDPSKYVDLSSGDLNLSIPLMTVPGNGMSHSITLNYGGPVKMNQEAGQIGLGFSDFEFAIYRQLNGYPDDWNGIDIEKHGDLSNEFGEWFSNTKEQSGKIYGPMYFKNCNTGHAEKGFGGNHYRQLRGHGMDIIEVSVKGEASYSGLKSEVDNIFSYPNYDQFVINAPGIGGAFQGKILESGSLMGIGTKKYNDQTSDNILTNYYSFEAFNKGSSAFEFYFSGDLSGYSKSSITNNIYASTDPMSGGDASPSFESTVGSFNGYVSSTNKAVKSRDM